MRRSTALISVNLEKALTLAVAALAGLFASQALSASQDDLDRLLSARACERCDLSGAALDGAMLAGAQLSGANLSGADLSGATLVGADLQGADLSGANLENSTLIGADLGRANLRKAKLSDANLTAANLTDADIGETLLCGASFQDSIVGGRGCNSNRSVGATGAASAAGGLADIAESGAGADRTGPPAKDDNGVARPVAPAPPVFKFDPLPVQTLATPPAPVISFPRRVEFLVPDDEVAAVSLINITNDFLEDVRQRKNAHEQFVGNGRRVAAFLNERFSANGVEPRFRMVGFGALERDIGLLGEVLSEKFSFRYTRSPEDALPGSVEPCRISEVTRSGGTLLYCYDNQPPRFWADPKRSMVDYYGVDEVDWTADIPRDELRSLDVFIYDRPLAVLESFSQAIGTGRDAEASFLLEGFRSSDGRIFEASPSGSEWRLHPDMRRLIPMMAAYLQEARRSWSSHEDVHRNQYRAFIADYYARIARIRQEYAKQEDILNANLWGYFDNMTEEMAVAQFGSTSRFVMAAPAAADFRARNAGLAREADELRACATNLAGLTSREIVLIRTLPISNPELKSWREAATPIFTSPIFLGAEMAPGEAAGSEIAGQYWFHDAAGPYRKGQGRTAVAAPATGLENMPAFGGIALGECEVIATPPGVAATAATAEALGEDDILISAVDTALP